MLPGGFAPDRTEPLLPVSAGHASQPPHPPGEHVPALPAWHPALHPGRPH